MNSFDPSADACNMKPSIGFFVVWLLFSAAKAKPGSPSPRSLHSTTGLATSVSKFNSKLLQEIVRQTTGNIFYSPVSLHTILSQLVLGSPKNSSTHTQLASVLHLDDAAEPDNGNDQEHPLFAGFLKQREGLGSSVKIANRLYTDQSTDIKEEFIDNLATIFKSAIEREDFSNPDLAAQHINQFVNDQTNGLIPKMLEADGISDDTKLILLNAIYFKGRWKHPFKSFYTKESPFHVDADRTVSQMSMVVEANFKTADYNPLQSELLALHYDDEKTAMIVILPNSGIDVRQVEAKLTDVDLGELWKALISSGEQDLIVQFPKFEAAHNLGNLNEVLTRLGLVDMFDESKADFSRISDNNKLSVSKIAQKAVIKVDEEGSEAAAATYVDVVAKSETFTPTFTVNRPFIFFIYDIDNNLPLFIGRIVDPNGKISLL